MENTFLYEKHGKETQSWEDFHFPESCSQFLESKLCPVLPPQVSVSLPPPGQFNMSHRQGFVVWNNIFSWDSVHAKHTLLREWKSTHKTFSQQQDPGGNLIRMLNDFTASFAFNSSKLLRVGKNIKSTTYLRPIIPSGNRYSEIWPDLETKI